MSSFLMHFSWFFLFFFFSFLFFILSLWVTLCSTTFSISMDLFSSWFMKMSFSISMDLFSSWFSFVVTFISMIIMIYSYFYMTPYSKPNYFIWMTVFFVLSMLMVINMSNFFFIMLGWDGLGLVSFFLIVYYQNYSSIYSGLFTVLMNRIGDCFFIISISLMLMFYPVLWDCFFLPSSDVLLIFMILTFMTKSAIYPFSPWLPMAMAAPTPISALVHSSTLVTAGLYLLMRFSFLFYSSNFLMTLFLIFSVFTSFYAGMNSIFETDMKKLIALSTLSHLGFIGMAFSCGLLYLSFFHLLVHALFKSVLFMSMGDIMTNLFHSQDIRFLSAGLYFTPSSFYIMGVSLMNLLGLPTISGYFSKDFVLETCHFTYVSFFLVFLVFFNVCFTYYYTYQLFFFSFSIVKLSPYTLIHNSTLIHTFCLLMLTLLGIFFGSIWLHYIVFFVLHVSVPLVWKMTPYILNLFIFIYLYFMLKMFKPNDKLFSYYFSNMMFLSCFMMTLMSNFFLKTVFLFSKTAEAGLFNWVLNTGVFNVFSILSVSLVKIFTNSSLYLILFSIFFTLMFVLLLLNNMKNYMQLLIAMSR